eukprot:TRINITY_DN4348_c0_g4_i6.p3 TRINITY_DN4348_c0_g4~~TRINITY_DN4348_c0_g4_i6.p3  ORF type:complete len:170 (-),score=59.70 TRINITY_DN4348_c0_g4_i6:296-805(-)
MKLSHLSDELMDIEMQAVDQINEQAMSELEESYRVIKTDCTNKIQNYFRLLDDLETEYHESVQQLAQYCIEKFLAGQMGELEEDASALLADKEAVQSAVQSSHDNHSSVIGHLAEEIETNETKQFMDLLSRLREEEYQRNRHRVSEIYNLMDKHQKDIAEKLGSSRDEL